MAAGGRYTAAICAAPKVLAHAGLLHERRATSYPGAFEPQSVPGLEYVDEAVVTDGRVITSRDRAAFDSIETAFERLFVVAKRSVAFAEPQSFETALITDGSQRVITTNSARPRSPTR
mgnify:CR=1 FL=1